MAAIINSSTPAIPRISPANANRSLFRSPMAPSTIAAIDNNVPPKPMPNIPAIPNIRDNMPFVSPWRRPGSRLCSGCVIPYAILDSFDLL